MSSDSSTKSKCQGQNKHSFKQTKSVIADSSSGESENHQTSEGSKSSIKSVKSIPWQNVERTGAGPPTYKSSVSVDVYNEESLMGTGTTYNSTTPTVLTAVLRDLHDDIVHSSSYQQSGPVSQFNGEGPIAVIGGDNVYVQNKSKFVPVPREKALSTENGHFWAQQTKQEEQSSLDVAVMLQKVFTLLSSMCFGLLGGVGLLQLMLIHYLAKQESGEDWTFFLESYSRFAELTPLLFYTLLAFCTVSVLDRVQVQQGTIICQRSWLVAAVYVVTLILTLSCASYDNKIVLYPHNKTLFQDQKKVQEFVSEWQLFNTLRCFFAILGWVVFSLISPPDLLLEELLQMKEHERSQQSSPTC